MIDKVRDADTLVAFIAECAHIDPSYENFVTLYKYIRSNYWFFEKTWPIIKQHAVRNIDVPFLRAGVAASTTISSVDCLTLICHYFLGKTKVNFIEWYGTNTDKTHVEKIKCIVNYINNGGGLREITITRSVIHSRINYAKYTNLPEINCTVHDTGAIGDYKHQHPETNCIEADFANKVPGGGVYNWGCVQEEILFCLMPELMVTTTICEPMLKHESITVSGITQPNKSIGYGNHANKNNAHFKYAGKCEISDIERSVVIYDAASYKHNIDAQYENDSIMRDLNKCWIAFYPITHSPIIIGNWGCGVYAGNHQLKFVIQYICAAIHKRNLVYYTFGAKELERANEIIPKLQSMRICDIFELITKHPRNIFDALL